MSMQIPSVSDVKRGLESLSHAGVQELSRVSGVPFTTIWKIRDGTTENPGMETVRKFWTHIQGAPATPQPTTEPASAGV